MRKYFKIFLLLFVVFIGINEVKAYGKCIMSYKEGKVISESGVKPNVGQSCDSIGLYYEIELDKGKDSKIINAWECGMSCARYEGDGENRTCVEYVSNSTAQWLPYSDNVITTNLKYEDFANEAGDIDCKLKSVCMNGTTITTNCDGKETHDSKTRDTKYHGSKQGKSVGNMCSEAGETIKLLRQVYTLLRYLIPVLIIVLSIVDFMKVVLSGEEKVFKEAWNYFIKRIIIGIVILLVPILIKMLINMAHINGIYKIGNGNDIFCIFS